MPAKPQPVHPVYADIASPRVEALNGPDSTWFGTSQADGYITYLLERFMATHPQAAEELAFIASEAKWSTGWKGFGRMLLEVL